MVKAERDRHRDKLLFTIAPRSDGKLQKTVHNINESIEESACELTVRGSDLVRLYQSVIDEVLQHILDGLRY